MHNLKIFYKKVKGYQNKANKRKSGMEKEMGITERELLKNRQI